MKRTFEQRIETFGFLSPNPWAINAFNLLFFMPRVYEPLVLAWEKHFPGTSSALRRLNKGGWISYQAGVVINTRTGDIATKQGYASARYKATAKGARLAGETSEDIRILSDHFPQARPENLAGIADLLSILVLEPTHARFGLSPTTISSLTGLSDRTTRWWLNSLTTKGYIKKLPMTLPDIRQVIPPHYRINKILTTQLKDIIDAYPDKVPSSHAMWKLSRTKYLEDIVPARIGISGATDFDHDIQTQNILAAILRSESVVPTSSFLVEPRYTLSASKGNSPWRLNTNEKGIQFYQPDAEIREMIQGDIHTSILEYERYQTRKDGWSHIEKFLGYIYQFRFPFEPAILRFVVEGRTRVRSYTQLIEAFSDYLKKNPSVSIPNKVTLAVSSTDSLLGATDPLDPNLWNSITLPSTADTDGIPVLHKKQDSPYFSYFSTTRR